jgi:hypothetical protein
MTPAPRGAGAWHSKADGLAYNLSSFFVRIFPFACVKV